MLNCVLLVHLFREHTARKSFCNGWMVVVDLVWLLAAVLYEVDLVTASTQKMLSFRPFLYLSRSLFLSLPTFGCYCIIRP